LEISQRQLVTIILPPDPVSILNARIEPYAADELVCLWCKMAGNTIPRMAKL
jgi:hypothetical protein